MPATRVVPALDPLEEGHSGLGFRLEAPMLEQLLLERAADEIERLREALRKIARIDYRGPMPDGVQIARETLREKE